MNKFFIRSLVFTAAFVGLVSSKAQAQLSSNPDKFLGNISTYGQIDYGNEKFYELWNQITPENESKWESIEGNSRGKFNWKACDKIYNYAKEHNFPFKFHCLVWGSQYAKWIKQLTPEERYEAIVEWMDAVKERYPDLTMIDVVNEAVSGHQADTPLMKEALGGDGKTGYDWIIKSFELAHERWPDAILIYNDFNTFQWNTDQYIDLVRTIRDAGAPIDAYGCQSHDLTDCTLNTFKNSMKKIQDALKMPMYISEYDIGTADDAKQLKQYQEQIPLMWEADYCAGVTLWGYIYGKTWVPDGNSGIIKDGVDRPAMTWLREYMQTDAAKQAKSPFPGMVKEASVYVKPASIIVEKGAEVPIRVFVRLKTKSIKSVDLYVNDEQIMLAAEELEANSLEQAFSTNYTPTAEGKYNIKAVVTATDGTQYERLSGFTAYPAREAYNGVKEIPGVFEAEDFDSGAEGQTFHDSDNVNEGDINDYRTETGGVDFVKGNDGCAIGYTAMGEWLEYSVDVKDAGTYAFEATVSCGSQDGSAFSIDALKDGITVNLCKVNVPMISNNDWNTYKVVTGEFSAPLEAGQQILRITIDKPYVNLDKIELKLVGTGIRAVENDHSADQTIYNLYGMKVDKNKQGIIIKNGKKTLNR